MPLIVQKQKAELRRLYALVIVEDRRILVSNLAAKALQLLHQKDGELSTTELTMFTGARPNSMAKCLQRLRDAKLIQSRRTVSALSYHKLKQQIELHFDLEVAY